MNLLTPQIYVADYSRNGAMASRYIFGDETALPEIVARVVARVRAEFDSAVISAYDGEKVADVAANGDVTYHLAQWDAQMVLSWMELSDARVEAEDIAGAIYGVTGLTVKYDAVEDVDKMPRDKEAGVWYFVDALPNYIYTHVPGTNMEFLASCTAYDNELMFSASVKPGHNFMSSPGSADAVERVWQLEAFITKSLDDGRDEAHVVCDVATLWQLHFAEAEALVRRAVDKATDDAYDAAIGSWR